MITCTPHIQMDNDTLQRLSRNSIQALELTADQVKGDVIRARVIPKDVGILEDSIYCDYSQSNQGKVFISTGANGDTPTPYARRLYFHPEYNFRTSRNPNAKGKWFEDWISGSKKDFAQEKFKAIYRRLNGGD